jgi:hypothetical protein
VSDGIPTSYRDLADILVKLPTLVVETRRQRHLNQKTAAIQIGFAPSTLCRFEAGKGLEMDNIIAVLHWFDRLPETTASAALREVSHDGE